MAKPPVEILQGTLDMLILKAVSLGPLHGYGILLRIQQISKEALQIPQGSLYPALYRLERGGFITSEWGESEKQSPLEILRADSGWAEASERGDGILGTPQRSDRRRPEGAAERGIEHAPATSGAVPSCALRIGPGR